jgi:hypothetical protein
MPEPRLCSVCRSVIDPVDECDYCQRGKCHVHYRPRKRKEAVYCSPECGKVRQRERRKLRLAQAQEAA